MISPDGITLEKSLRLGFSATNNKAEYEDVREIKVSMMNLSI